MINSSLRLGCIHVGISQGAELSGLIFTISENEMNKNMSKRRRVSVAFVQLMGLHFHLCIRAYIVVRTFVGYNIC